MKVYKELKSCTDLRCKCVDWSYDKDLNLIYLCNHPNINLDKEERVLGKRPEFFNKCPILQSMINNEEVIVVL